jgi:hypothetical protein
MVAYLQDSALDDERLTSKLQEHRAKGVSIPLMHEAMQKWYYKDPQGEIQGQWSICTLNIEVLVLLSEPPVCLMSVCIMENKVNRLAL